MFPQAKCVWKYDMKMWPGLYVCVICVCHVWGTEPFIKPMSFFCYTPPFSEIIYRCLNMKWRYCWKAIFSMFDGLEYGGSFLKFCDNISQILKDTLWEIAQWNKCWQMMYVGAFQKLYFTSISSKRSHAIKVISGTWAPLKVQCMMTSSNGNIVLVIGSLCGEFNGDRWIPLTKANDAELWCFLWSAPEYTVE